MDSFYGGRKGRDFAITPANKQENKLAFDSKVALVNDLKQRWQSPIGVGDYVLVSYGMASDEGYSEKLQQDLNAYKKSYNSTLWEKIYTESEYTGEESEVFFLAQKKGLGYRLVTSMTGNTPKFVSNVTVIPVSPDTPPTASIDSTNVDSPELVLKLPKAQYMTVTNDAVDANEQPTLTWVDTFTDTDGNIKKLDNPTLVLHLPLSQVINFKDVVVEDADVSPSLDWDDTDSPDPALSGKRENKVNSPDLTFHLPQAQQLKNSHVTVVPKDVTDTPSVELVTTGNNLDGSKKVNEPELIFRMPVSQRIDWLGLVEVLEAGSDPEIVWQNDDIITEPDGSAANTLNSPKLGFKLPRGQKFRQGPEGISVRLTDVGKAPTVALDTTGAWADGTLKANEPGLIFTLPLSQKINFLGWNLNNVLDANEPPRVEWKDTDDTTQDGVQSDLNNTPTLEFFLPQAQVLQAPTQIAAGPTILPSVEDIGTVNEPKYRFTLPKAVKFYNIDDAGQTSTTLFAKSLPDVKYDPMEVGDYLINSATGFLYVVSEKTETTIRFNYQARFSMYVPSVAETPTTTFSKDSANEWQRNEISVERKYLDTAQTQVQFLFTIPNQPRFEFTVTPLAPAETMGISSPSIKDDSTITHNLQIPRGSRIFASSIADNTLGEKGDVWLNSLTGDLYNHNGLGWEPTPVGNIKGPQGNALNIIKSFTYDSITESPKADTIADVSKLLERDLGITSEDDYPNADELIKVTWIEKDRSTSSVISETSYWYFYLKQEQRWDRAQVTAGLGDVIANVYSSNNEDNKTYSIKYINNLIDDDATTELDKKTYSIEKINQITSWQDLSNGRFAPLRLFKGTTLPTTIKEGSMYLITVRDGARDIGNNLFVDISDTTRVQISASKLSKSVVGSGGSTTYVVVEAEDVVAKSKIANAAENAVLVGAAKNSFGTNEIKAIPNASGAFHSDGLTAPKFGTLPLSAGGVGATNASDARDNLEIYSKTETDELVTWGNFADLI